MQLPQLLIRCGVRSGIRRAVKGVRMSWRSPKQGIPMPSAVSARTPVSVALLREVGQFSVLPRVAGRRHRSMLASSEAETWMRAAWRGERETLF
jgi:hypothetical protein